MGHASGSHRQRPLISRSRSRQVTPGKVRAFAWAVFNVVDADAPFLRGLLRAQLAPYFAKVECFCFDEQKILAGEEVDLPVFFFIDRDVLESVSLPRCRLLLVMH